MILRLAQMAGINHHAVYKATTIDPPGTIAHARSAGAAVIFPDKTFFQLMRELGYPNRFYRFCCQKLKEYKVNDVAVQGIRKSESTKRAKMYKEPTGCRIYGSKKNHVEVFYPILEWTDEDVKEFVKQEHIQCHPLYYDENGCFHPERRLGCMCCPLKSRKLYISSFEEHPRMVRAWIANGKIWMDNHPDNKVNVLFKNIYEYFYYTVFCESYQDFLYKIDGMFGRMDAKTFLEDHFGIDLP